jgi:hypothetical protein
MSVLRNLEARIEGLVEGVFSRAFSSQVQPVEIARKLAKEMDSHKTASVSQVYAPNSYTVWLSPEDHERLEGYTRSLSGYTLTELLREVELLRDCVFNFVAETEIKNGVNRADTVRALRTVNQYFGEDIIFVVEHYLKRNASGAGAKG